MRVLKLLSVVGLAVSASACMPALLIGTTPTGEKIEIMFYNGGTKLDDLIVIKGQNYFGKAQYQQNDPLGDVGFRLKTGERVTAECSRQGNDVIGKLECKEYTVVRSNFSQIAERTRFLKPELF